MLVSSSPHEAETVFLTEERTSAAEHERARQSPETQAWAASMPTLVAGPPDITPLDVAGGTELSSLEP